MGMFYYEYINNRSFICLTGEVMTMKVNNDVGCSYEFTAVPNRNVWDITPACVGSHVFLTGPVRSRLRLCDIEIYGTSGMFHQ